jgi:hypothetical protein
MDTYWSISISSGNRRWNVWWPHSFTPIPKYRFWERVLTNSFRSTPWFYAIWFWNRINVLCQWYFWCNDGNLQFSRESIKSLLYWMAHITVFEKMKSLAICSRLMFRALVSSLMILSAGNRQWIVSRWRINLASCATVKDNFKIIMREEA